MGNKQKNATKYENIALFAILSLQKFRIQNTDRYTDRLQTDYH